MRAIFNTLLLGGILHLASAQFPPEPEGITILKSKFHENVTISYKEPGICETTPGVKSYAGYVHLPPGTLDDGLGGETQNYSINTFFWFFEARKAPENAPLAIWLNGGPGGSSMMGLLEELGPCFIGPDSKTSVLNPWSWNNEVNMLFLDQPTQVGFSYDVPTNGSQSPDEVYGFGFLNTFPEDFSKGVPETNLTYRVGTFASQDPAQTANSTARAAHALWHFAQTWFFEFPHYTPLDDRISLWAESYGGHYGPGFFSFFQRQNERIANGTAEDGARYLHLDTLGIVNGYLDMVIQGEASIIYPYNNTYGIQVFNQSLYDGLMHNWTKPGGCKERVAACQKALKGRDPVVVRRAQWKNLTEICGDVPAECTDAVIEHYQTAADARGWFDIGHPKHDPFPAPHMLGYLTQASALAALGVPVNFSESSMAVGTGFQATFDLVHGGFLEAVAYLLDSGVKVHMMYGDRDYACNWIGGERASLAVPYSRQAEFAATGYMPLVTPDGLSGMTRQLGNFSFSRVYQAGHEVPSYQPIAAYEIFMRATFNRDIATGLIPVTDEFSTVGPKDTWKIKNVAPEMPTPRCYILRPGTCVPEIWEKVKKGSVVVKDWFVVDEDDEGAERWQPGTDEQQVIEEL